MRKFEKSSLFDSNPNPNPDRFDSEKEKPHVFVSHGRPTGGRCPLSSHSLRERQMRKNVIRGNFDDSSTTTTTTTAATEYSSCRSKLVENLSKRLKHAKTNDLLNQNIEDKYRSIFEKNINEATRRENPGLHTRAEASSNILRETPGQFDRSNFECRDDLTANVSQGNSVTSRNFNQYEKKEDRLELEDDRIEEFFRNGCISPQNDIPSRNVDSEIIRDECIYHENDIPSRNVNSEIEVINEIAINDELEGGEKIVEDLNESISATDKDLLSQTASENSQKKSKNCLDKSDNPEVFNKRIFDMKVSKKWFQNLMADISGEKINEDKNGFGDGDGEQGNNKSTALPPERKLPRLSEEIQVNGRSITEVISLIRKKFSDKSDSPEDSNKVKGVELDLPKEIEIKWLIESSDSSMPTSMSITPEGVVVVADYGNSCLEILTVDGAREHQIDGVKPFCVSLSGSTSNKQFAVGDRKCKGIRFFYQYGTDVAQWENMSFEWVSGISFFQDCRMVVYDRARCKVSICTPEGVLINEFGSFGQSKNQFCMADFLVVDRNNRILVCDSGNHCVKIFDAEGMCLNKFSERGHSDGCLWWPKGICLDPNENILVADTNNNRISCFSPDGQFIKQLIPQIETPFNLCYEATLGVLGLTSYSSKGKSRYGLFQCN